MELIPLLSTVILVATVVTIVFAVFSYLAYRAREKKVPRLSTASGDKEILLDPQFFKRYIPPE
jgi:heme/copper-type cytochrome/quinol oxidase subunit 2